MSAFSKCTLKQSIKVIDVNKSGSKDPEKVKAVMQEYGIVNETPTDDAHD